MFKLFRYKTIHNFYNWQTLKAQHFHKQLVNKAGIFKPTQIICKSFFFVCVCVWYNFEKKNFLHAFCFKLSWSFGEMASVNHQICNISIKSVSLFHVAY